MALSQARFLLDENVPHKLLSVFYKRDLNIDTLQSMGWSGISNGGLSEKIQRRNLVLITRDRDFTFLWRKYRIKVIYLAIEPSTPRYLQPKVKELLDNWNYDLRRPFLVLLQKDALRFWQL